MRCPSCGHDNREDARFCDQCAAELVPVCPSCQAQNDVGARFCRQCREPLGSPAAPTRTPTPEPAPALPASFAGGRYQVQRFLGEGGKKRVYLAHDSRLDRDVAIALIKSEGLSEEGVARIRREAQAMGQLGDHPHIVTAHDIGEEDGRPYIIMEYMDGGSLDGRLQQANGDGLALEQALRIGGQVAQALEHAHGRGIIHRDLKPGNIWLTQDPSPGSGQAQTAKLGDFGFALAADRSRLTQAGMMVGTPYCMPPEQALGGEVTAASDLYSLGCVLYEMVAGRPPFPGDDPTAVISQHINTAPVAPSWYTDHCPPDLEELILKLLAKAPDDRPQSAGEVREALERVDPTEKSASHTEANVLERLARGVFVGREKELDGLRKAFDEAFAGHGSIVMLVGEPGIGKTRAAQELETYARMRGAQVLWGTNHEAAGAPPYQPWVQAGRTYGSSHDPTETGADMEGAGPDLVTIFPELRQLAPNFQEPEPSSDPESAQFRLFDAYTRFVRAMSLRTPILIALDDLHWTDKGSLLLLQHLARELSRMRVLIVCTYRDTDLVRTHPLSEALATLNRESGFQRIGLRGLSRDEVANYIRTAANVVPAPKVLDKIYEETEGNPFFLSEVVNLMAQEGTLTKESVSDIAIPDGVREALGRRLNRISEEANELLQISAVVGSEFTYDTLTLLGERDEEELLRLIEEALEARVIEEMDRPGYYRFTHAQMQETLLAELSTTRRVRLHGRVGEALEKRYGDRADERATRLAGHFVEAAMLTQRHAEKAVHYSKLAAEQAEAQAAWDVAARHYEHCLTLVSEEGQELDDETADLLFRLGRCQQATLQVREAWRALRQAFTYHAEAGNVARAVDVAVAVGSFLPFLRPTQTQLIERALELVEGGSREEGRLLACLGFSVGMLGDYERAEEAFQRAWAIAEREGDPRAELGVLRFQAAVQHFHWRPQEAMDNYLKVIDLAQELDDPRTEAVAHFFVGGMKGMFGDPEGARHHADADRELAERLRDGYSIASATYLQGFTAFLDGNWDAARSCLERGLEVDPRDPRHLAVSAALELELGDFERARAFLDRLIEVMRTTPPGPSLDYAIPADFLPHAAIITGEMQDLPIAEEAARVVLTSPVPVTPLIAVYAHRGLAILALFRQDRSAAQEEYAALEPFRGTNILRIASLHGRLALMLGRVDDAVRHIDEALALLRSGYRVEYAWTAYDGAGILLQRGAEGDRGRAGQLLDESLAIARELGMRPLMDRVIATKVKLQGIASGDIKTSIDAVAAIVESEQPDLRRHAAPDGTVTLLFTDIEGSTPLNERLGDQRWMALLRAHNALVREQLRSHDGYEVKTEGDGFMVAFGSARKALQCAIAVQRAFAAANADRESPLARAAGEGSGVRVRIGLHTGEMIQDAGDFYGKHVNLASRIANEAKGGEILVSSLLRELTESGGDIEFGEGREVVLKGLSGTQRVYKVGWE